MVSSNFVPQPGDEPGPQKQYSVNLSLQGLVGNMSDRASAIATAMSNQQQGGAGAPDLHPEIAQHLQRVAELSQQLQAELDLIAKLDPDAFAKLKQA